MMLLICILERCGKGNECEINYEDLHERMDQPVPTLKNWAAILEERGVITKTKTAHGSRVLVNLNRLPAVDPDPSGTGATHDAAIEFVRSLRGTVVAACDGFLSGRRDAGE